MLHLDTGQFLPQVFHFIVADVSVSLAGKCRCVGLLRFATPAIEHLHIDTQLACALCYRHFALFAHAYDLGYELCVKVFPFHLIPPLGL